MMKVESDQQRGQLRFCEAVISAFRFLVEEYSFSCVTLDLTYVRYESELLFVNVYHGRASFELNVEIGEKVTNRNELEDPFTLQEILRAVNPQKGENFRPYQVTTAEAVKKFVSEMGQLVREHAAPGLTGDHKFFQRLNELGQKASDNLLMTWKLNRARSEVEKAWAEKDFKHVIEIYESVKEHLTAAEARKLAYARKTLCHD